jgi:UDP:flavonoid glycosyltransferase YjiC (YdhE family)
MGDLTCVTDVPEILGIPSEEMEAWKPDPRYYRPTAALRYTGAIYAELSRNLPKDVSAFLDTPKQKVYVALTSGSPEYLTALYTVLQEMDVRAVFCTTRHTLTLKPDPDILVKDFLPSHKILPLTDLAVIHGGQGSVQTAIASGTPLIGFPLQAEQNFNLSRIQRHGAGISASRRDLRPERLCEMMRQVLEDPSCKKSMQRLQQFQARLNGPSNVAKRIIDILRNRGF